jgi:hypothetical protein
MTCIVETLVPARQLEQVADDVAPVTAEYVPAKRLMKSTAKSTLKTSAKVNSRRYKAGRLEANTSLTVDGGGGRGGGGEGGGALSSCLDLAWYYARHKYLHYNRSRSRMTWPP